MSAAERLPDDEFSAANGLPTWTERYDGFQHVDGLGRVIRIRFSRFHGAMVTVDDHTAYLGDPAPLIDYLTDHLFDDDEVAP